ncbi:MAG: ASCH domain-containing protein [Archaeoglobaceae archaeon]
MKHLEFDGKYAELILSGRKRATIRKWVKLREGDEVYVHSGGKIIGKARILSVEKKKIDELSEEDAILDGFSSREELLAELKRLGYDGEVYVVKFEFEPMEAADPRNFYYGDADLEEVAKLALRELELSDDERRLLEMFLKYGSIRKVAARLGGWRKRGVVRKVLRKCYEELRRRGLIR